MHQDSLCDLLRMQIQGSILELLDLGFGLFCKGPGLFCTTLYFTENSAPEGNWYRTYPSRSQERSLTLNKFQGWRSLISCYRWGNWDPRAKQFCPSPAGFKASEHQAEIPDFPVLSFSTTPWAFLCHLFYVCAISGGQRPCPLNLLSILKAIKSVLFCVFLLCCAYRLFSNFLTKHSRVIKIKTEVPQECQSSCKGLNAV